jgi:hypothetical protein
VRRIGTRVGLESTSCVGAGIAHYPVRRFEEIANVMSIATFECWIVTGVTFRR